MDYQKDDNVFEHLQKLGFTKRKEIYFNLGQTELIEYAIKHDEGFFSSNGALSVNTTPYTGRSPKDKYIVDYDDSDIWLSDGTQKINTETFETLKTKVIHHLQNGALFVRDAYVGANPSYKVPVRVITDTAWQNLAASNLFIENEDHNPFENVGFTIIVATKFFAEPEVDKVRSKAFVILDFKKKIVLIGASTYAGEIKKSVFTVLNYLMPKQRVLSLHCSANQGKDGDVALFFGLSGTGKTTLSSDQSRFLIGDDEHGWCDDGIFNFEGGCYAKTIRLDEKFEPLVWSAVNRFGAILENVKLGPDRVPDFDSNEITENTRSAYPLHYIPNFVKEGYGNHPSHIFLLTADAFGVLPPLARLNKDQALYYFLSGYTSKLAGTERGLGQEPEATFSACFGAPFLPLHPGVYAELLGDRLEKHSTRVWLLNTGWQGGGYGVGKRISLPITRTLIKAVLSGALNKSNTIHNEIFNLDVPTEIDGVDSKLLNPEMNWANKENYRQTAQTLAKSFKDNFQGFSQLVPQSVSLAGPK